METHVMLDLETMGTAPSAAIVQIGAVTFRLGDEPYVNPTGFQAQVALQSSLMAGGSLDIETMRWWCERNPEAQHSISADAGPLAGTLQSLVSWWPDDAYLWSHGAAFDVPVLESAFRAVGLKVPYDYRRVRDTRTLFDLAAALAGWQRPKRETAHTALADARAQAEDVVAAWKALKGWER